MSGPWEDYAATKGPWTDYQRPKEPSALARVGGTLRDVAAGAVRGAGSIGATIVAPYDVAKDALAGKGLSLESNRQRRADMDAALADLTGADTDSMAYGGGKLLTEVAGTLGVGGTLANAATRVAPRTAAAFPGMIQSIRTAGMTAGQPGAMGARVIGGAVTGGASAGLVNPEEAGTGALIGGGMPAGTAAAGWLGQKAAQGVKSAAKHGLGLSTGVGAEPVSQAFKAGQAGNREFLANMRGEVPLDDVLNRARDGLSAMRADRAAQYRSGMVPIKGDRSVLALDAIDQALAKAQEVATFKGQTKSRTAADVVSKMREAVDEWRGLDPREFHTPEGLDALKQKLGDIMEALPFENRQARMAAGQVYAAAKKTIEDQAPTYARVMRDYSQSSDAIREIERALSLGDKASRDTAMRKLQSLMRNNVQTNYGNRLNLANALEAGGNVELMPSLAGQAMSSATPRSLSGQMGAGGAVLASLMTGNMLPMAALPVQSPRLVGEAAYGLGRAMGGTNAMMKPMAAKLPPQALAAPNDLLQALYRAAPVAVGAR